MPKYNPKYNLRIPKRTEGDPEEYTEEETIFEMAMCADPDIGPLYFIHNYCHIEDNTSRQWIPFELWPAQVDALMLLVNNKKVAALKSRQVGMSWLCLCFVLWHALFEPAILGLLFSKREEEAKELLDHRVKGIYRRLPEWMKSKEVVRDSKTEWEIANGSRIKASSSGGSDSYAATHVLVDEADIIHESKTGKNLKELITAVSPTVDSAGGWMILISRSDKSRPNSTFKNIFRAANKGVSEYVSIFIPWFARPDRTEEWYRAKIKAEIAEHGTDDGVKEQYPAKPEDALSGPTLGKRFPSKWIKQCYLEMEPLDIGRIEVEEDYKGVFDDLTNEAALSHLDIFRLPQPGREYILCIDGAEGGEGADDSSATMFDWDSGEEVAYLGGEIESTPFARYCAYLARFYNGAKLLPERNNIGKTLILWWQLNASDLTLVKDTVFRSGKSKNKQIGWQTTGESKPAAWSKTADLLKNEEIVLHSLETTLQLMDISADTLEGATLKDDRAMTVALFAVAKKILNRRFLFGLV